MLYKGFRLFRRTVGDRMGGERPAERVQVDVVNLVTVAGRLGCFINGVPLLVTKTIRGEADSQAVRKRPLVSAAVGKC